MSDKVAVGAFVDNLPFSIRATYGGNTSCVELTTDEGAKVILDCGSGIRPLGLDLMKGSFGKGEGEAWLFISHFHWDHMQGWPFFVPLFIKGNKFHVHSGLPDIQEAFIKQQEPPFFPVPLNFMTAGIAFRTIPEGEGVVQIGSTKVSTIKLYHPGDCYAYRFDCNGRSVIYATDSEFSSEGTLFVDRCMRFMHGANLLIMDAQYTFSESHQKLDWGHSSASTAIDLASASEVDKLVLFHHEPTYEDDKIDQIAEEAMAYHDMAGSGLSEIIVAREGLELEI